MSPALTPLPALSTLRAFEAAARHQNYTRAAEELAMTQAAVSYQIRLLETRMGVPLFRRQGRGVVLTDAGARLADGVVDAFARLRAAVGAETAASGAVLSITALPTIGGTWLAPRLPGFQRAHPNLAVRLDCSIGVVDMRGGEFDIAIRTGRGDWPGTRSQRLMPSTFSVVCAPEVAQGRALNEPRQLLELPLFGRAAWWLDWFAAAGLHDAQLPASVKTDLGLQHSEVRAAIANRGAAIVSPVFFAEELRSGALVQPFDITVREQRDYWLVYPADRAEAAKIVAFRRWLLGSLQTVTVDP